MSRLTREQTAVNQAGWACGRIGNLAARFMALVEFNTEKRKVELEEWVTPPAPNADTLTSSALLT